MSALNRIMDEAPYLSRCSSNKTAAKIRPREHAVNYPWMQINRSGMVSWLIFDLDHTNPFVWQDENLPEPNIAVINRNSGKSHLFYAIVPVCTTENARSGPIQYMKSVYNAMGSRLDADPAYSGPVAKTPGHPWWHTLELHNRVYDLGELSEYVELEVTPWGSSPNIEALSHSRHEMLFEWLRHYAYSIVNKERESGSFTTFNRLLDAHAHNKNNFKTMKFSANLTANQVAATVKSVARWTWDKYHGDSRCHRGVMGLDPALPLNNRQQASAARTHQKRQSATESKIRLACANLLEKGERLTQVAVATLARITRQTVAKYKHLLTLANDPKKPATNVIQMGASCKPENVTYGVHQIPASLNKPSLEESLEVVLGCDDEGLFKEHADPPKRDDLLD